LAFLSGNLIRGKTMPILKLTDEDGRVTKPAWIVLAAIVVLAVVVFFGAKARAEGVQPPIPGIAALGNPAPGSWTGLYVGVGGGYQIGDLELSEGKNAPLGFNVDGLSMDGWTGDVRIGFDWQMGSSPFVIGVLGGHKFGEAEFSAGASIGPNSIAGVDASINPNWYVGGRAGYSFGKSLAYVGYAYQWADAEGSAWICDPEDAVRGSTNLNAHVFLAGLETAVASQITLGLEYSLAKYEDVNISDVLNVDPDVHAVTLRLNWRPFSK
jgi:opacity protein-like surface antigen